MKRKICNKCKRTKPLLSFYKRKNSRHGRNAICIKCISREYKNNRQVYLERCRIYRRNNKIKINIYQKHYYINHTEKYLKRYNVWCKKNPDKLKKITKRFYAKNKYKINKYAAEFREKNKEILKLRRRKNKHKVAEYIKNRLAKDKLFKMQWMLRTRIRNAFKAKKWIKTNTTKFILGCSFIEAKNHIESLFLHGMTWDNHGEWHIDHKKPLSLAKTEKELIELCHYKNIQPLWAADNLKKGNKFITN